MAPSGGCNSLLSPRLQLTLLLAQMKSTGGDPGHGLTRRCTLAAEFQEGPGIPSLPWVQTRHGSPAGIKPGQPEPSAPPILHADPLGEVEADWLQASRQSLRLMFD